MKLFSTLRNPNRNPTVDIFRALAIIAVVLYHFKYTIYMGFLGVDLFFVISGFLVGGLLINDYKSGKQITFGSFFLRRGFKIWPSYYFFLLAAGLLGYALFKNSHPEFFPPNWWKYIFFYKNYQVLDDEWIYDHAWSLCVEEHFYIILPLVFIAVQRYGNLRSLIIALAGIIVLSDLSKMLTYFFSANPDTYFPTHTRIDALGWGVLLNILITYSDFVKKFKYKWITFFVSSMALCVSIKCYFYFPGFYSIVLFHATVPVLFAVMLGSIYYVKLTFLFPLRVIGYYSYNWYLWHPIAAVAVIAKYGIGTKGLIIYLCASFFVAVIFTTLIEEPFLGLRKRWVGLKTIAS